MYLLCYGLSYKILKIYLNINIGVNKIKKKYIYRLQK